MACLDEADAKPTRVALDGNTARRIPKFLSVFTMTYGDPELRIHRKIYDFPNLSKTNKREADPGVEPGGEGSSAKKVSGRWGCRPLVGMG